MASSIYIYKKEDYDKLYKGKTDAFTFQTPILEFYLKPAEEDQKLWVITNTTKLKERVDFSRSICHFTNGQCREWIQGDEILVEKDNVFYNPKNNKLEIFPRKLRKPLLSLNVDKVVGGRPSKKTKIKLTQKFYDMTNDRLNFFI